jgi:hypothetical protein
MTSLQWSPPYSAWVYVAAGVALAVLLLVARRWARSPAARGWALVLLRAGVLALLLFILLNLVRVTETRLPPRVPEVVYLVDCSRSMALDRPHSRLDQVKQAMAQSERRLPPQPPHINLFRFGDELTAASDTEGLRPTEDATRLLDALDRLPSHFTDGPPAGVVVFSDGRATETAGFEEVAAGYRRLGVPVHVFPVGDRVAGDVAVQDVIAPRDAPPGTRLPVRVVVRSRGYEGRRAEVRVRPLADPSARPLASLPITLADGAQAHDLVLEAGATGQLVAEVPPLENEAILENNRVAFQVGARRQKLRVIYMEGSTNNEYHWLRDALVEDPNIECVAMEVNDQYAARPVLYRVDDPSRGYPTTREELFGYDVVICSDIAQAAFTPQQLAWTVELVEKRGGGFAMVGGHTSFDAGYWDKTVWDGLIPVDMGGNMNAPGLGGPYWDGGFAVKVPREAERHPIWRIVDDPVKNRQVLDRMPAFSGTNLIRRLKPAATPLGYTDRAMPGVGIMPVFACQTVGKGRSFAMATDTTYAWGTYFERDWGEPGDNRYFRKFWRNVVNWLAENSAGVNRRLRVDSDKIIYRPGEAIKLSARAYDEKLEETSRYRLVARLHPPAPPRSGPNAPPPPVLQEVALAPRPGERAYEGGLTTPPLDQVPVPADKPLASLRLLALDVVAYDGNRVAAQSSLDVQVLDDPEEFHDPQPDPTRLEALARDSGGKVLHSGEELAQLLRGYASTPGEVVVQKVPLWDRTGLWLLLLGLLGAEWVLRRWRGLA